MRIVFACLLFCSCVSHDSIDFEEPEPLDLPIIPEKKAKNQGRLPHISFLIQTGKLEAAIDELLIARKEDPYFFHSGVLENFGLAILLQGRESRNIDDLLQCLYAMSISLDERGLPVVQKALFIDNPEVQLAALSVLASLNTDHSHLLMEQAMRSDYLVVRLEAAYLLAQRGGRAAFTHIDTLLLKVPPELRPFFAELFALEASGPSITALKHLLFDADVAVRSEAIRAVAATVRDDLFPEVYCLSKEPSALQQEACAYAFGAFLDERATEILRQMVASGTPPVALSASYSLALLGHSEFQSYIESQASQSNLFAIQLLGRLPGTEKLLVGSLQSPDVNVRVNAVLALLKKRDSRCLEVLARILIDSHKDYAYQLIYSPARSLSAWKVVPSSSCQKAQQPYFFEISLRLREDLLSSALELSELDFLTLAHLIFERQQHDLIPHCVRLLQNLNSEAAIDLLKEHEEKVGAPFVRAWCRLALFRMNEPGPYEESVRLLVEDNQDEEVFQSRPFLPWSVRADEGKYSLTFEESARLLIESFEALAKKQDEKGIEALLMAIRNGNEHNRYTLAGLLIRASQ